MPLEKKNNKPVADRINVFLIAINQWTAVVRHTHSGRVSMKKKLRWKMLSGFLLYRSPRNEGGHTRALWYTKPIVAKYCKYKTINGLWNTTRRQNSINKIVCNTCNLLWLNYKLLSPWNRQCGRAHTLVGAFNRFLTIFALAIILFSRLISFIDHVKRIICSSRARARARERGNWLRNTKKIRYKSN